MARPRRQTKGAEPGAVYGRLTVQAQTKFGRGAEVSCKCGCGSEQIVTKRLTDLKVWVRKGRVPSCGCWTLERLVELGRQKFDPARYLQKTFGRLLVTGVDFDERRPSCPARLVCRCECGAQAVVRPYHLTAGKTLSCGCFHKEVTAARLAEANTKHGNAALGELNGHTPLYRAWMKIRAGCLEGWRVGFHRVSHEYDPRWEDFTEFYKDFGPIGIHETISRLDNKMPWTKDNCFVNIGRRWLPRTTVGCPLAPEEAPSSGSDPGPHPQGQPS